MWQGKGHSSLDGHLFWNFVRVFEQHFDLSFVRSLKCKYTVGGILEHRFCLVWLMECINMFSECYWTRDAILWRFLECTTNWVGPLRTTWIRWVLLDTSPLIYFTNTPWMQIRESMPKGKHYIYIWLEDTWPFCRMHLILWRDIITKNIIFLAFLDSWCCSSSLTPNFDQRDCHHLPKT